MGMFSYLDVTSDERIVNGKSEVRMYWLENGIQQEEMRGIYNGYGSVDHCTFHEVKVDGEWHDVRQQSGVTEKWLIREWDEMVDMSNAATNTGMCVILEENRTPDFYADRVSEFDPAQGAEFDTEEDGEFWLNY